MLCCGIQIDAMPCPNEIGDLWKRRKMSSDSGNSTVGTTRNAIQVRVEDVPLEPSVNTQHNQDFQDILATIQNNLNNPNHE